jgi:tRNA(Ile2) C34 agmatinyltransferase TiaS
VTPDSIADLPHSVFEPECPRCGLALRPDSGWIWRCPGCSFAAERVAGTLLEIEPEAGRH